MDRAHRIFFEAYPHAPWECHFCGRPAERRAQHSRIFTGHIVSDETKQRISTKKCQRDRV